MNTRKQPDSSNKLAILPMWVIDRIKEEMRLGPAAWQAITDAVVQAEVPQVLPCEVKLPPGTVIGQGSPLSTLLMAIAQRASQPAHAQVFCSEPPVTQPHPEPIAWMVGTAFWWTKEEAERDEAETGLPIVGLGPMTSAERIEQHQGSPVLWRYRKTPARSWFYTVHKRSAEIAMRDGYIVEAFYHHADSGEVERLASANAEFARRHLDMQAEVERLRAERKRMDEALVSCANERDSLRTELTQCEAMATMIAEREWAEHVGTGDVSSKVEAAFTQLHNDLHEAGEKLAERDAHPLRALGQEAYSTLVGMVEFWLNKRVCLGMDEGYKNFLDEEDEHDFVKELRNFVALSATAAPGARS